jgi:hypothetical protein
MLYEVLWYVMVGALSLFGLAGLCAFNIRYERGRRRLEAEMTPEQRRWRDVLANGVAGGLGLSSPRRLPPQR